MTSLRDQGLRAFQYDILGRILIRGFGLLVAMALARLLLPSEFGLVSMAMVFIGMSGVFTDFGFSSALIQREDIRDAHSASVLYFNCVAGLIMVVITFAAADTIAAFFGRMELSAVIKVLSFCFLLDAMGSTQSAMLRRELRYELLARAQLAASVVAGVIAIALALSGYGVWCLVAQILLTSLTNTLLLWHWGTWRPESRLSLTALGDLWTFGFHMFLASLLQNVIARIDYLVIGKFFQPATLGFYERAKFLSANLTQTTSNSLMSVLFPVLSKIQSDLPRLRNVSLNLLSLLSFVTFLVVGGLYIVSFELVSILFGEKWHTAAEYFSIIVLSGFSYPLSSLLMNILRSTGKSRLFLRVEVLKKMLVLINLGVLYQFGITTYLYTLVLVSVIVVSINLLAACRVMRQPLYPAARPLLAQALVAIISALFVEAVLRGVDWNVVVQFVCKGGLFVFSYTAVSAMARTAGYSSCRTQLQQVLNGARAS